MFCRALLCLIVFQICFGERICLSNEYKCNNRNGLYPILDQDQCILNDFLCDGIADCPFGDDEWNCPSFSKCIELNGFQCKNTIEPICISSNFTCDNIWDCPDQSDESNETCNQALHCNGFVCNQTNYRCLPSNLVCDKKIYDGCLNGQDELNCDYNSNITDNNTITNNHNATLINIYQQTLFNFNNENYNSSNDINTNIDLNNNNNDNNKSNNNQNIIAYIFLLSLLIIMVIVAITIIIYHVLQYQKNKPSQQLEEYYEDNDEQRNEDRIHLQTQEI